MSAMKDWPQSPGPLTITVPTRHCATHGDHAQWVQFRFDEPFEREPHYCMRCLREFIDRQSIGKVYP